jgi:hypothetical protein
MVMEFGVRKRTGAKFKVKVWCNNSVLCFGTFPAAVGGGMNQISLGIQTRRLASKLAAKINFSRFASLFNPNCFSENESHETRRGEGTFSRSLFQVR